MGLLSWATKEMGLTKLNPAQPQISGGANTAQVSLEQIYSYQQCYEQLEVVNRAVNMIVDDVAQIKCNIGDDPTGITPMVSGMRKKQLDKLLNKEPNPFQDISSFRRALVLDFLIDGNMFIYWDGAHMYHVPASKMNVISDTKTYVSHYEYEGQQTRYEVNEILHIKDNNYQTIYRGSSRLKPALRTMRALLNMRAFQDNFFKNGAVPGLTLQTDERLNDRHKEKLLAEWAKKYQPTTGGKRPVILDGGLKINPITQLNFQELDFQNAINENEKIVLKALGIPPILLDGGNNANIRPNHRIYYLETILPIVEKMNSVFERFFGFEVYEDVAYIHALRPELQQEASYHSTLVNGGVITPNEARFALGKPPIAGHDDLRIPANIAGSAADPSTGGRPSDSDDT
jgi:HK97 family phage portal protein